VGDLDKKPEARKLVSGILDLPSLLRLRVIAEGIETA
jgi:predicted signal transduction protein with EAL and GGDEF domain